MRGNRWGPEGPPADAYSRVTEPERFEPLHAFALELVDSLESRFDVDRTEGIGLEPELEGDHPARATVRLVPRNEGASPITVAFTSFPGIRMRYGRWCEEAFPRCGCDACDETAEGESQQMGWVVEQITAGRFRESLSLGSEGEGWLGSDMWSPDGSSQGGGGVVDGEQARALLDRGDPGTIEWEAWPRRS